MTVKQDLADLTDCLESLKKNYPKLSQADKIDMAARTNAACKLAEELTGKVKDEIKKWLKEKPGEVKGAFFKAVLTYTPAARLDQKLFKEEEPEIHAKYTRTKDEARVTFAAR